MLLPIEKNLVSMPWSLTRGSCQGGWRGAWGPGTGGAGLCQMFSLVWIQYLIFFRHWKYPLESEIKIFSSHIFPRGRILSGVEGMGNTVTQRENGIVRFKKVFKPREIARKGERERKKKLSQSPHLSSLSKTHPSGKIPEEKDIAWESSRAGGTPTEPSPFSNYIQGCPDRATTP